jgi:tryptophan-rich sensory protein
MKKIKLTELLIFIVSAELAGALSGLIAGNFSGFYQTLIKPPLSPPGWIFPIVWSILYALMGISAFLIYSADSPDKNKKIPYLIYTAQLFVNFMWSIIFFRFKLLWVSVAVIILLIILIVAMIVSFHKIRPAAAYINIPYLLWVAFAAYLNIGIAVLN